MNRPQASNNQVKSWKKLLMSKYRKREGLFLAEGIRCIEQILHHRNITVTDLIVEPGFDLSEMKGAEKLPVWELSKKEFSELSDTETPQGILAICKSPHPVTLSQLTSATRLIIAFDAIQDPGNLGTMIRTASWFHAGGLLFGNGTADPFHPKVVRSTAGATGTLPYMKADLHNTLPQMEENGWKTYILAGTEHAIPLHTVQPGNKSIIVIGNEGSGVHPHLFEPQRVVTRIPGNPEHVESLNAAIALSIALYRFTER